MNTAAAAHTAVLLASRLLARASASHGRSEAGIPGTTFTCPAMTGSPPWIQMLTSVSLRLLVYYQHPSSLTLNKTSPSPSPPVVVYILRSDILWTRSSHQTSPHHGHRRLKPKEEVAPVERPYECPGSQLETFHPRPTAYGSTSSSTSDGSDPSSTSSSSGAGSGTSARTVPGSWARSCSATSATAAAAATVLH